MSVSPWYLILPFDLIIKLEYLKRFRGRPDLILNPINQPFQFFPSHSLIPLALLSQKLERLYKLLLILKLGLHKGDQSFRDIIFDAEFLHVLGSGLLLHGTEFVLACGKQELVEVHDWDIVADCQAFVDQGVAEEDRRASLGQLHGFDHQQGDFQHLAQIVWD